MYGYVLTLSPVTPKGRTLGASGVITWTPGIQALIFRVEDGWAFQLVEWGELDGFYRETDPVGPFRTAGEAEEAARVAAQAR
jgi:hypothetical protein